MPLYKLKVLSCHCIMLALKWTVLLLGIHYLITGRWPSSGFHLIGFLQDGSERDCMFYCPACFQGKSHSVVHLTLHQGISPVLLFQSFQARMDDIWEWKSQSLPEKHILNSKVSPGSRRTCSFPPRTCLLYIIPPLVLDTFLKWGSPIDWPSAICFALCSSA